MFSTKSRKRTQYFFFVFKVFDVQIFNTQCLQVALAEKNEAIKRITHLNCGDDGNQTVMSHRLYVCLFVD